MNNTFFIIDNDNWKNVKTRFYGYAIDENGKFIYTIDQCDINKLNNYSGGFIAMIADTNSLQVIQDANGTFGIYCYRDKDYFAISNSLLILYLYLVKVRKLQLSINEKFLSHFIICGYMTHSIEETIINGIMKLSNVAKINISVRGISIDESQDVDIVSADSIEALEILDKWINKYVNIIRNFPSICRIVDVTGGKDSRISLGLALASGVDLNSFTFFSTPGYKIKEDFKIALELGKQFGFEISSWPELGKKAIPATSSYFCSIALQMGFHGYPYFESFIYSLPFMQLTGQGGEGIRNYNFIRPDEYFNRLHQKAHGNSNIYENSVEFMKRQLDIYRARHSERIWSGEEVMHGLAREALNCSHFGHSVIRGWLSNAYRIAPLLDSSLQMINVKVGSNNYPDLLSAIISLRIYPGLLEHNFVGNINYNDDIISLAEKINVMKPCEIDLLEIDTQINTRNYYLDCKGLMPIADVAHQMQSEFADANLWHYISENYNYRFIVDATANFGKRDIHHPESDMFKLLTVKYFMNMSEYIDEAVIAKIYEGVTMSIESVEYISNTQNVVFNTHNQQAIHCGDKCTCFTQMNAILAPYYEKRDRNIYGVLKATDQENKPIYALQAFTWNQYLPQFAIEPHDVISSSARVIDKPVIYGWGRPLHYGHFITEGISRLWFAMLHPEYPILWQYPEGTGAQWQKEVFEFLGLRNEHIYVDDQTIIKELIIPVPAVTIGAYFEQFWGEIIGREECSIIPGKKLFISRRLLPESYGGHTQDDSRLDSMFANAGYEVIYIERLPFCAQLKALASAEKIVGIESSCFHSAIFLHNPNRQRYIALCRHLRGTGIYSHIAQVKGLDYNTINVRVDSDHLQWNMPVRIDFPLLKNMIDNDFNDNIIREHKIDVREENVNNFYPNLHTWQTSMKAGRQNTGQVTDKWSVMSALLASFGIGEVSAVAITDTPDYTRSEIESYFPVSDMALLVSGHLERAGQVTGQCKFLDVAAIGKALYNGPDIVFDCVQMPFYQFIGNIHNILAWMKKGRFYAWRQPQMGRDHVLIVAWFIRLAMLVVCNKDPERHPLLLKTSSDLIDMSLMVEWIGFDRNGCVYMKKQGDSIWPNATGKLNELARQYGTDKTDHKFPDFYETIFAHKRGVSITLVEIGVYKGASLNMWSKYFQNAQIVGVDITEKFLEHIEDGIIIEIGSGESQATSDMIMGKYNPDIVVDDASHKWSAQIQTFLNIFPKMKKGSFYVIEDIHTSFSKCRDMVYNDGDTDTASWLAHVCLGLFGDDVSQINMQGCELSSDQKSIIQHIDSMIFKQDLCVIKKK